METVTISKKEYEELKRQAKIADMHRRIDEGLEDLEAGRVIRIR